MKLKRCLVIIAFSGLMIALTGPFNFAGAIDVHLTGLSRDAAPPGESITIYGQMGARTEPNEGMKTVELWKNGDKKGDLSVVSWENNSVVAMLPYGLPSGTYKITVCQTFQDNCSNLLPFTLRPATIPDIRFEDEGPVSHPVAKIGKRERVFEQGEEAVLTPEDVKSIKGKTYSVDFKYEIEEFNGKGTGNFDIKYYWKNNITAGKSAKYVGQVPNVVLQPQQVREFHSTLYLEHQEMENYSGLFRIELDEDNAVDESTEINNTFKVNIKFDDFDRPDLVVKDIKLVTEDPKAGDNIEFLVTVANLGYKTAPASRLAVRFGGRTSVRTFDITPREPGHAHTLKFNTQSLRRADSYRVTAIADYDDQVQELRENNNEDFIVIKVGSKTIRRPLKRNFPIVK